MSDQETVSWNVKKILDSFGTVRSLRTVCEKIGAPVPGATAVKMWRNRGSIPSKWLAVLIYAGTAAAVVENVCDEWVVSTVTPIADVTEPADTPEAYPFD